MPCNGDRNPLQLTRERWILYAAVIAAVCLLQVRYDAAHGFGDWSAFWSAGSTAGTADLLDPVRHAAWQKAHGVPQTIFPYLPGAAWLLLPFKFIPLGAGYAVNMLVMACAAAVAALLAARTYRIARPLTAAAFFGWAPLAAALAMGQNSPLGLLLAVSTAASLAAGRSAAAGLFTGILLYKPTYALPLLVLFAARRNGRALAVAGICAAVWYLAGVAACAGDWQWPVHYLQALGAYAGPDARFNAARAIAVPHLLLLAGVRPAAAVLAGAAIAALTVPLLARRPVLEAASFAPLIGLAAGPHALPYDVVMALPAILYAMTHAPKALRTPAICAAYVTAPLWLVSGSMQFDVLAVLCDGLVLVWLLKGLHESATGTHLGIAHSGDRG